jgi:Fe-S-cluster containining protein
MQNQNGFLFKMHVAVPAETSWNNLCNSCTSKSCCKSFAGANLLPTEFKKIKETIGKDTFVETVMFNKIPTLIIKKKYNSDECTFWDSQKECCSIYENRPFDCKLFPFDIHEIEGQYMWIINSCNPDSNWSWTESILNSFEDDPSFPELINTLGSYSYPESTKNNLYDIKILRPVNYSK